MKTNNISQHMLHCTAAFLLAATLSMGFTACHDDSDDPITGEPTLGTPKLGQDQTSIEFLTNWENCQVIKMVGIRNEQYLPWYGASGNNIPNEIAFDIKKENGWEMAFCELNDPNANKNRMFGLYNKYTGILRVFHYIDDTPAAANELIYWVAASKSSLDDRYPLYHLMEYGIPANHAWGTTLNNKALLRTASVEQEPFSCYISPYTERNIRTITPNWHCFDIDLSGYLPEGKNWREGIAQQGQITIFPVTVSKSDVSLTGELFGSIEGSITDQQIKETGGGNSMSGVCGILNSISSFMSGQIPSAQSYYSALNNKNIPDSKRALFPYLSMGSMALNVTSAILGYFGEDTPVEREIIPGKIDLGMNAKINLSGVISAYTANNEAALKLTPELMNAGNGNGNMGAGVWGLAEDPVIYVSKEDLMASVDHMNIGFNGTDYSNAEFYDYDVRLVSFFDPRTVKVNLNTGLFHNVRDVVVTSNYGIYTNRDAGYTKDYRDFMKFEDYPTFSLTNGKTGLCRLNHSTTPHIHEVGINDLVVGGYELAGDKENKVTPGAGYGPFEKEDVCRFVTLPGSDNSVYGRQLNAMGKEMIMMPQVFVTCTKDSKFVAPQMPDFLVTVNITFTCDEGSFQYSKTFIPQVKLIGHNDLSKYYDELSAYAAMCQAEVPVGSLANDRSVNVYDKHSDLFLTRTIKMLAKCR